VRTVANGAIRPFSVHVPQAALDDLRRRLAATRWPDQETVTDRSQGVQLAIMKEVVRYWQTGYGWRKAEAKLNALPQFVTTIDRAIMGTRPQTLGYGLADSPVAFAAFMYDYNGGEPQHSLTKDDVLDNVTLYWLTNTAVSSARIYWENDNKSNTSASAQNTSEISLPVAVTVFPGEIYRAPKSWTQRAYRNLVYFNEVDRGGHFAAWEQPQLFSEELRAAFRSLRGSH
jgi:hypothetical protein